MLELRYEEGHVYVDCDTCDTSHIMSAPPILVKAHNVESDPELLGTFTMAQLQQTIRGFCNLCSGPVEGTVADSSLDNNPNTTGGFQVTYECTECGAPVHTAATTAVLDHPAVVSLLHDAGIDYREIPSWELMRTLNSEERVRNDDPVRVEVTVSVDDELTLVLDANLNVVTYRKP